MKKQTKSGFKMTGAPEPVVSSDSKMPWEALHSTAGEPYVVPSQGKNVAGGKEFMRAMLSKEAAVNFAKTKLASTIVKGTVPADGFGSTALVSQVKLIEAAGSNVFSWNFIDLYGMNQDQLVVWNTFLQGGSSVAELTKGLQTITDKVAKDDSIKKVQVQ
jgi:N-acetylglucosamine transport system substrate-binding protein